MPSQVELMHKQFREKKELLKNKKMKELISRYGGDQHLVVPDELREGMKAELEDYLEMQKLAQSKMPVPKI
jgi:pre-mRNA-processing factor SLU7